MSGADLKPSRLIPGTRAEKIRVRADTRDGRPVVRIDLLEPIASHAGSSMTVKGPALMVPIASVTTLLEALYAAKVEAGGDPEPKPPAEEF